MATTAVAAGTTKVAQGSKLGAGFEIVQREIPSPGQEKYTSKSRPVGFATVTCSPTRLRLSSCSIRDTSHLKRILTKSRSP
jgi:hypothetical protein